ncbi:MAG: porphobilinogen synthase [Simkania sp.]|nr:porphobilinogen synthase [Simkania sp.]
MLKRPRRNRKNPAIRSLVEETRLSPADLVAPLFVIEGEQQKEIIHSLPGIERLSIDLFIEEVKALYMLGIPAIAIFPAIAPHLKDDNASLALDPDGLIPRAIRAIKRDVPKMCVISDIALDPFTSHGHDGVIVQGDVHNDQTIEILNQMAILHAHCGSDFVAPSDMMDGRVGAIRKALDTQGFSHTGILSYCAKYASSLYAPFREAVGSSLLFGDKKTYQMNPANVREAMREAHLDEEEGADILMVKPALLYLDVIRAMREQTRLPICAYHVSGEYAMVMAAEEKGFLNADRVFYESLLSIKRAGADFIISYAAKRMVPYLCS